MARLLVFACCLLLVNAAHSQEVPPGSLAPAYDPASDAYAPVPVVPAPIGYDPSATVFDSNNQYIPPPSITPDQPALLAQPPVMAMQPPGVILPPVEPSEPLTTVVYSVADLVVGLGAATDPNQALMAMLMQQSEEFAYAIQAAAATASAEPQQDPALTELAATIESTFAAEFENGRGTITPHRGTHSLIIRQTDAVHAQIGDLLDQLRHINGTEIKVTIELSELNDATTPFAFAHNGQVLDEATLAEFRELTQSGESELAQFTVATRNGEKASLPMYALPGSVTAVASADHREVRVLLDMLFGMEMGISQTYNHRIPSGETLLTIMAMEDTGLVVLLTAEIEASHEARQQVSDATASSDWESRLINLQNCPAESVAAALHEFLGNVCEEPHQPEAIVASDPLTNSILINASPRLLNELSDIAQQLDAAPVQIETRAVIVECESLPEDFCQWALERFDGAIECDNASAIYMEPGCADELVKALQEENFNIKIHSRPQFVSMNGVVSEIQIGQVVPVVNGVSFANNATIPIVEEQPEGIFLSIVPTLAENGDIELQLEARQTKLNGEVVLQAGDDELITSPIIDSVSANTTVSVPQGCTVILPVPGVNDSGSTGSMLLFILTPSVAE